MMAVDKIGENGTLHTFNSVTSIYDTDAVNGAQKIVALSTCESAETDGRLVVFAVMSKRNLIKLTLEGCGYLEYQGQQYTLPPGHMFWIDCRKRQSYRTHPATGHWRVMWIHFYGANAQFYYDLFLSHNGGSPVTALAEHSPVYPLLSALLESDSGSNQQRQDLQTANFLHQLISECALSVVGINPIDDVPQTIQSVRLYLMEHYRQKLTLDKLGKQFNLNPFYLQKQFKRYIGQSPTEYLIYLRMTKAKELMRTTNKSISEIANLVGFENLGYFTRRFKQQEGTTPHEYCKLWPTITPDNNL